MHVLKGKYRHFKGGEYLVIGEARHSETGEDLVIYCETHGQERTWARPKHMFFEKVEFDTPNGRARQQRFVYVGDDMRKEYDFENMEGEANPFARKR